MKLRIRGDSLRLRLTRSEVDAIGAAHSVSETMHLPDGSELGYTLAVGHSNNIDMRHEQGRVELLVTVETVQADRWATSEQVAYVIESEGIKICHLGFLNKEELSSIEEEEIGDIDILMVPVGGGGALDAKKAAKIVSQIEPKIIIPMHYHIPGLKPKLSKINDFLEVLGIKSPEQQPKLSIKKRDISGVEAKTIILTPAT